MFETNLIPVEKNESNYSTEFLEVTASLISTKNVYTFRNKFDQNFDCIEKIIKDQFQKLTILRIQNWITNLVSKSIQYYY